MIELPDFEAVQLARERLGQDVHKTPVLSLSLIHI